MSPAGGGATRKSGLLSPLKTPKHLTKVSRLSASPRTTGKRSPRHSRAPRTPRPPHPLLLKIAQQQDKCVLKKAERDTLRKRLDSTITQMSEVHNASPHADLESSDIQDLAKLMRRQLRQFAQFVRSEARILSTMPELLFQRCTHCINESAPQSIGTYVQIFVFLHRAMTEYSAIIMVFNDIYFSCWFPICFLLWRMTPFLTN